METDEMKGEFKMLHDAFERVDKDGDGILELSEFVAQLKKAGYRFQDSELKALFGLVETDHSGTVNFKEFIATCLSRAVVMNSNVLHRAFAHMHRNMSEEDDLKMEDLAQSLPSLPQEKVEALYRSMDVDKDGAVTFLEFRRSLNEGARELDLDDDKFFSARSGFRGMMRLCTGVW